MGDSAQARPARGWLGQAAGYALAGAALTAASLGWVFAVVLPSWNAPQTCVADVPHTRSSFAPAPALARRVVLVVVDGMGHDVARDLPELAPLREAGAFRRLDVDFPTFTSPAVTALVVGQGPRESGVRLNGELRGTPGLDSLTQSAWDAGVFVRVRSRTFPTFETLVRPPAAADRSTGRWSFVADLALLGVLPPPSTDGSRATDLVLVHFGEVDEAGHACGSECAPYREAAAHAGASLVALASRLDPERDLLLAVSDHGTLVTGGHGGDEEMLHHAFALAWGAGVRSGQVLEPRPIRDVASTLAVALGVPTPSSNLGSPMLDMFDLGDADVSARFLEPFDQASRYACGVRRSAACEDVDAARVELERGRGEPEARAVLARIVGEHEQASAAAETDARAARGFAGVVAAVLLLWLVARRFAASAWPASRLGLLAPAPVFVAYTTVMMLRGYGPSLSAMAGADVFLPHAIQAGVVGALALVLVGLAARWSAREAGFAIAASVIGLVPIWAIAGADPAAVPSPLAGCLVFQLTPLVAAASLGGVGLVIGSRLRTAREARSRPSSGSCSPSAARSGSGSTDEDGSSRTQTGSPPA